MKNKDIDELNQEITDLNKRLEYFKEQLEEEKKNKEYFSSKCNTLKILLKKLVDDV